MIFLSLSDFLFAPLYLLVIYLLAYIYRNTYIKDPVLRKYFIWGLSLRMFGAFAYALVYQYYFRYGDTVIYFRSASIIYKLFSTNPSLASEILWSSPEIYSSEAFVLTQLNPNIYINHYYSMLSTRLVVKIAAVIGLVTGNTYLNTSFIISAFSFMGCWQIFRVFAQMYPHFRRNLAIACLFVPSVFFWGTGIMKDPICLFALGYLTASVYNFFIVRRRLLSSALVGFACMYLLFSIKAYILLAFLGAGVPWIALKLSEPLRDPMAKRAVNFFLLGFAVFGLIGLYFYLISLNDALSLEVLIYRANALQEEQEFITEMEGGSGYSLGTLSSSPLGIAWALFSSINVTLFRPYFWETQKLMNIPLVLESFITFVLTLRLFWFMGLGKTIRKITSNPDLIFCIVFSLIFAASVGFVSFNYGTLARYKIPLLPFYFSALAILYGSLKKRRAPIVPRPVHTPPSSPPSYVQG